MGVDYDTAYRRSLDDPEGFWAEAAAISWVTRWDRVLDDSRPPFYRWFAGGVLNTCYNAVDRHVERGRGRQTALIYDSPVTGTVARYSYDICCTRSRRWPARSPTPAFTKAIARSSTCLAFPRRYSRCSRARGWA